MFSVFYFKEEVKRLMCVPLKSEIIPDSDISYRYQLYSHIFLHAQDIIIFCFVELIYLRPES